MNVETDHSVYQPTGAAMRTALTHEARLLAACGLDEAEITRLQAVTSAPGEAIDEAIASGLVPERSALDVIAAEAGVLHLPQAPPMLDPAQAEHALGQRRYVGVLDDGRPAQVLSPGGAMMLVLAGLAGRMGSRRIVVITRQHFIDAVFRDAAEMMAERMVRAEPTHDSAAMFAPQAPGGALPRVALGAMVIALITLVILAWLAPRVTLIMLPLTLAPIFLIAGITVLACMIESFRIMPESPPLPDAALPGYSVLVPLYREANILDDLLARLACLDYPRGKLDVILLVEADDAELLRALDERSLPGFIRRIIVPPGIPRTKPRALNAGLMVATGELTVVFDAEDAPEPDQLRRAAAQFAASPERVICMQARLAISNSRDGWLPWRFAIDYAALFDCGKSGMAGLDWPVPLGGSSNHFRTALLREIGGWDAWNVTEDADLGIRIARAGLTTGDLASTTWEEAPNTLRSWLNQRTRWMKGWMQTMLVHGRDPVRLIQDLGTFRALIIACFTLAVVLGALLFPLFLCGLALRLSDPTPLGGGGWLTLLADAVIIESLAIGLMAEVLPALVALKRRRSLHFLPGLLLAPLIYLLTSIAAWRAAFELVRRPFHWHKTMHGLSRRPGSLGPLS